jgi:hypothetical protein
MKTYGGVDVYINVFLKPSLIEGEEIHAPAALPPGKEPPVPNRYETEWTPELERTLWRIENSWPYRDSNSGSFFASVA